VTAKFGLRMVNSAAYVTANMCPAEVAFHFCIFFFDFSSCGCKKFLAPHEKLIETKTFTMALN
jgi:hypothetical protein